MCVELLTKLTAGYRRAIGQFLVRSRGRSSKRANRLSSASWKERFQLGDLAGRC